MTIDDEPTYPADHSHVVQMHREVRHAEGGSIGRLERSTVARRLPCMALLLTFALTGCATLPAPTGQDSFSIPADATSGLGRAARASMSTEASSAVRELAQASYAMNARLALIEHAEHTIDLQYYLLRDDDVGQALARALHEAAGRGVRIRLLVDDLYTSESSGLLRDLSRSSNVEVRLFNPFPGGRSSLLRRFTASLMDLERVNHRMHNKLFIADGAFAIAGGRNLGNEYFRRSQHGNFLDFDVLLAGSVVPELATVFDRYWNSRSSYPFETLEPSTAAVARRGNRGSVQPAVTPPPGGRDLFANLALGDELSIGQRMGELSPARVRVFADPPEKVDARDRMAGSVTASYLQAVKSARERVIVISPYFVPGDLGLAAIGEARARGLRVTIITNAMDASDEPYAAAAYARYREQLLELGVELFEMSARRMQRDDLFRDNLGLGVARSHAKMTIIDDSAVFVGSMNLDLRSARLNTELGLLIESTELATQSARIVERLCASGCYSVRLSDHRLVWISRDSEGREVVSRSEPAVGIWTRIRVLLFAPFIPDGLL